MAQVSLMVSVLAPLLLLACVRCPPVSAAPAPLVDPATALAMITPLGPYITAAMWLSPYPCKRILVDFLFNELCRNTVLLPLIKAIMYISSSLADRFPEYFLKKYFLSNLINCPHCTSVTISSFLCFLFKFCLLN
jgi:hypothetical protein